MCYVCISCIRVLLAGQQWGRWSLAGEGGWRRAAGIAVVGGGGVLMGLFLPTVGRILKLFFSGNSGKS